uniref:SRCR domain-containing protein n=1 Tax=Ciona intestinalis TaxID=7719 RepID=H2XK13_CIOIN
MKMNTMRNLHLLPPGLKLLLLRVYVTLGKNLKGNCKTQWSLMGSLNCQSYGNKITKLLGVTCKRVRGVFNRTQTF